MVWARRIQELLEVVPGWCRPAGVALWARRLALYRHDKVVVAMTLVILLLLEAQGLVSLFPKGC
jgi:hypothetical protein